MEMNKREMMVYKLVKHFYSHSMTLDEGFVTTIAELLDYDTDRGEEIIYEAICDLQREWSKRR